MGEQAFRNALQASLVEAVAEVRCLRVISEQVFRNASQSVAIKTTPEVCLRRVQQRGVNADQLPTRTSSIIAKRWYLLQRLVRLTGCDDNSVVYVC